METKDRTTRTITGMLAALAVLVVATLAGNVANAMSEDPEGANYGNCLEAWEGSPAFNTCTTVNVYAEDGQCRISANCEIEFLDNQTYGGNWKGVLENVWSLHNCSNLKLRVGPC